MLFLENEVLLEAAITVLIENHHPDRVKIVLCKFAPGMEKQNAPCTDLLDSEDSVWSLHLLAE